MSKNRKHLSRILIVTPEVTYLPDRMGSISWCLSAKAGGLADVSASLVCELYRQGADVHIAIPNYRAIFGDCLSETLRQEQRTMRRILPDERLYLAETYRPGDPLGSKATNKVALQKALGLIENPDALVLFWPSRLDPVEKGCQLLSDILYQVISTYWEDRLQVIFVADGPYQQVFWDIIRVHGFEKRVAVHDYDSALEHLGYGAADFVLIPSRFEPCGLPQMIGSIYGALPIAHEVGGLRDTVRHLNPEQHTGNGFLFKIYDSGGLFWAIQQAVSFYHLPTHARSGQISRIMAEAAGSFNHEVTACHCIDLYQKLLRHPVIDRMTEEEIGSQKDKRQTAIETKQLAIDWQRAGNPLGRYR